MHSHNIVQICCHCAAWSEFIQGLVGLNWLSVEQYSIISQARGAECTAAAVSKQSTFWHLFLFVTPSLRVWSAWGGVVPSHGLQKN